jgi:transcriptional regulator with XRE-family HTH domain
MVAAMKQSLNLVTKPFFEVVDVFLKNTGYSEQQLSRRLFSSSMRLAEIRRGDNDPRARTLVWAYEWMSNNWPDHLGVAWPTCNVSRPRALVPQSERRRAPARLSA